MLSLVLTLVATTEELSLQAQVHELRSLVRDQGEELAALKSEVAALKSDNEELQRRVGTPSKPNDLKSAMVTPLGTQAEEGRRLSGAAHCCRWTPDGSCAPGDVTEECSRIHKYPPTPPLGPPPARLPSPCTGPSNEHVPSSGLPRARRYVEDKVVAHEFEDINTCLGSTQSDWTASYDGVTSNVSLNNGYSFPTPLKVTHGATCGADPTLELQLSTSVTTLAVDNYTLPGSPVTSANSPYTTSCCVNFPSSCGTGTCDPSSALDVTSTWVDATGLTETITVTSRRAVLAHYSITSNGLNQPYMVAALFIESTRQDSTVSIQGATQASTHYTYHTNQATWMGMLDPGSYTFKVRYRAAGVAHGGGTDWSGYSLQVLQL